VTISTTSYGNEVRWNIDNGASNGPYGNSAMNHQTADLTAGAHTFYAIDTFGDGWHGGYWQVSQDGATIAGGPTNGQVTGTGGGNTFYVAAAVAETLEEHPNAQAHRATTSVMLQIHAKSSQQGNFAAVGAGVACLAVGAVLMVASARRRRSDYSALPSPV
jgi:hypothetical protein